MRLYPFLLLFTGLLSWSATCQTPTEAPKNILFIAVDDLKPLLNCYGFDQMKTPHMDRLAERGVTFLNAHVQQAVCGPSRASLMTGTYPDRTQVWDLHTDFRQSAPDLISMPEYLISQGYETTGIGKIYHKPSAAPGHDGKSWSIPHSQPDNFDPAYGDPAFTTYQDPETKAAMAKLAEEAKAQGKKAENGQRNYAFKKLKPSTEAAEVSDEAYQDGIYTQEAIRKLKRLKEGGKPFFLGVGYQKPHLPFVAPKKYWDLYQRDQIDLAAFRDLAEGTPRIAYHNSGELKSFTDIEDFSLGDQLPEDKQRELIHGYMACVSYVDAQVGKLLDALDELGLTENTLIVLWGDHGFHLGDHTLWCKHSNFEQATHIPLIFAGPGIAENVKTSHPVEAIGVFPSLFELAGVPIPEQVEGRSLVPLLDKKEETRMEKDFALSQYHRGKDVMGYSIRTDRYRYTEWHNNSFRRYLPYKEEQIVGIELYDYQTDPNETKNLADDKAHAQVKAELKSKLLSYFNQFPKP